MLKTQYFADHHSLTCFLNSLFLEWPNFEKKDGFFVLPLDQGTKLIIPIKSFSLIGRHHYGDQIKLLSPKGERILTFQEVIEEISRFLSLEFKTDQEQKTQFINRVLNSRDNIKTALESREQDVSKLYSSPVNFKMAEQGLFIGHSFHPTPKSRSEFNEEDYRIYSPEMAGSFELDWVLLSQDIFFEKTSKNFTQKFWIEESYLNDFDDKTAARGKLKEGFTPFPLHPWQKKYLLQNPTIKTYIDTGKMIFIGSGDQKWYPTSSLRTLYSPEADYMFKFSMNVRLTNSIRHLLVHELDRGLQVHDVFNHLEGAKFSALHPEFEVIYEPAYAGIKTPNGEILQESLMLGRFNPFKDQVQAITLATLTQDHPLGEANLVQRYIQKFAEAWKISIHEASQIWFKEYLSVCLKPLLIAQANYGILLGSHQQNMVVEIENNLPIKSYFRDCNGTGYSTLGHNLFSHEVQSLDVSNGNILDHEIANYLFGYYVMINSTFNVISSIAHAGEITEEEMLHELKLFLTRLKSEKLKDESFLQYVLERKTLMHKGNFLCCFKNINENTAGNPLSIYTEIPNPIFERSF